MVLQAAGLKGNEILLDLACGTGIYSRPFAHQLNRGAVFGLDLSIPMLKYASKQALKEGLKNIRFMRSDAMDLPFSGNSFEVVNCCGALHLFADVPHILSEISRVLKPGGRFTFAAFRKRANALAEHIARLRRNATGMNAFRPDELELQITQVGFREIRCHHAKGIWLVMSAVKQH